MLQVIRHDTTTTRPYGPVRRAPTQVPSLADLSDIWMERPKPQSQGTTDSGVIVPFYPRPATVPGSGPEEPNGPSKEDKLDAELQSYLDLPYGWDGHDGIPAPLEAVRDALDFLCLRPEDIPLPYPQIGPDGEVGLYWRTDEVFAEVSFLGDGEYCFYARHAPHEGQPVEQGKDGCSIDAEGWDEGLLMILNKIVQ